MIERVVENVLDNALRYTPLNGRILLRAIPAPEGRPGVQIRIGNTGSRIPSELRAVVFEKFGQGPGGLRTNLGLGMYFCRIAAEAHGGRIWIDEEPELPTVFVIELPLSRLV